MYNFSRSAVAKPPLWYAPRPPERAGILRKWEPGRRPAGGRGSAVLCGSHRGRRGRVSGGLESAAAEGSDPQAAVRGLLPLRRITGWSAVVLRDRWHASSGRWTIRGHRRLCRCRFPQAWRDAAIVTMEDGRYVIDD